MSLNDLIHNGHCQPLERRYPVLTAYSTDYQIFCYHWAVWLVMVCAWVKSDMEMNK